MILNGPLLSLSWHYFIKLPCGLNIFKDFYFQILTDMDDWAISSDDDDDDGDADDEEGEGRTLSISNWPYMNEPIAPPFDFVGVHFTTETFVTNTHVYLFVQSFYLIIAPLRKSGSYIGFTLSFRHSVILSFCNLSNENFSSHFSQELQTIRFFFHQISRTVTLS